MIQFQKWNHSAVYYINIYIEKFNKKLIYGWSKPHARRYSDILVNSNDENVNLSVNEIVMFVIKNAIQPLLSDSGRDSEKDIQIKVMVNDIKGLGLKQIEKWLQTDTYKPLLEQLSAFNSISFEKQMYMFQDQYVQVSDKVQTYIKNIKSEMKDEQINSLSNITDILDALSNEADEVSTYMDWVSRSEAGSNRYFEQLETHHNRYTSLVNKLVDIVSKSNS